MVLAYVYLVLTACYYRASILDVAGKEVERSVATLGKRRFVSPQCAVGLFSRVPARDQFNNGSHPDGCGAWIHNDS